MLFQLTLFIRDDLKNGDVGLGLTTKFRVCPDLWPQNKVEHDDQLDQPWHVDWAHRFAT